VFQRVPARAFVAARWLRPIGGRAATKRSEHSPTSMSSAEKVDG
jgi:hypothetical protein